MSMNRYDEGGLDSEVRFSVTVSAEVARSLKQVAAAMGITTAALVRGFLERGLLIEAVMQSGGIVIARTSNGAEFVLEKDRLVDQTGELIWSPKLRME